MEIDHRLEPKLHAPSQCAVQQSKRLGILFPVFQEHLLFINRNTQMVEPQRGQNRHIVTGKPGHTFGASAFTLGEPVADIDSLPQHNRLRRFRCGNGHCLTRHKGYRPGRQNASPSNQGNQPKPLHSLHNHCIKSIGSKPDPPGSRVLFRGVVEHQNPIERLTLIGREKGTGWLIDKGFEQTSLPVAGVKPPGFNFGSLN